MKKKLENLAIFNNPEPIAASKIIEKPEDWIGKEFENSNEVILGDSGYPLRSWLLVPYLNPKTDAQKRFNYAHSKGRTKIEHAFGQLKRRFRICYSTCELDTEAVPDALLSCFLLHNIATKMRLPEINEDIDDEQPPNQDFDNIEEENLISRNRSEAGRKREAVGRREAITSRFD